MRKRSNAGWLFVAAVTSGLAALAAGPSNAGVTEHTFVARGGTASPQRAVRGFLNASPITIPVSGPASLYPSPITVADVPGTVWDVGLVLRGFTHGFPDDLDVVLVSPQGTRVVFLSDAGGGTPVSNALVRVQDQFFDPAAPFVPDDAPLTGPPYPLFRPRNWGGLDDTFPAPAPQSGALYTSTSAFKGENPNGEWRLYVLDDSNLNAGGMIAGGWLLDLRTTDANVFTAIPGSGTSGPADPYPSSVDIPANLGGRIKKVRVRLQALSHTYPEDVDVLLEGPGGQTVVLMSDAGGSVGIPEIDLTFDDDGPPLPDQGVLSSGTFRPTNHAGLPTELFPAPAPAPPYGTALSVFNGTRPVGTWRLWAVDQFGDDVGYMHNWAVEIQTVDKGDFDRDNLADLLWRHDDSGENVFWYMNSNTLRDGEFTSPPALADTRWRIVGTDDFNRDGKNDILWRHTTEGQNVLWFMDKNVLLGGTFIAPAPDLNWQIVATGDFNGDGQPDILWRNDVTGEGFFWFMDGATMVGGAYLNPAVPDTSWRIVGTGHFDSNVHRDIVWWNQVTGDLVVWFMTGIVPGHVEATVPAGVPDTRWRPVAVGDFNGNDSFPDIVWRHSESGQNAIWYMGGGPLGTSLLDGRFTDPAVFADVRWKIVGPR